MTKPLSSPYFQQHPDHILGEVVTHSPSTGRELTDRFGKPRPEVRGTLEAALDRIVVSPVSRFNHFQEGATVPQTQAKIAKVIALTREEENHRSNDPTGRYVCGENLVCLSDSIVKYNTDVEYKDAEGQVRNYTIMPEEIAIFVTYQVINGYWDPQEIKNNAWGKYLQSPDILPAGFTKDLTAYDGSKWYPASVFYAGNIYSKIQEIRNSREAIEREVGEDGYLHIEQQLNAARPKPLRFTTDPREALLISPFDRIWDDFLFSEDTEGIAFERPEKVLDVFKRWLRQLAPNAFTAENGKITSKQYDITHLWLDGGRFPQSSSLTEEEKVAVKRNATLVGTLLFEKFCIEGITRDMQVKIEYLFNATRNHYAPVQYHRIPVGFEVSKYFKGGSLSIRPAQREGVAFLAYRGAGIVAYDVGVGKTATAILGTEDGFNKGLFRRPLIVTPNGVYWKWIAEINGVRAEKDIIRDGKLVAKKGDLISEGILPHRKVNSLYNLGAGIAIETDARGASPVADGSITMMTYEGLEKLGFRAENEGSLIDKVRAALSQSEGGRDAALKEKSAETWLDKALLNTEYNIEDFGFDAIIVDECHNFRVLFTEVKGDITADGEREVKRFQSGGSGQPSGRAVKLFLLNLYIQSKNKGRNTFGLSATPFTNRATEIYSMLAHFDYDGLSEFGVNNLSQFCKVFIDETSETVWTAAGKFDIRYVIRGYNNVPVLQSMLFRSINYKTGEEANIQRPQKVILPLVTDDKGLPLAPQYIVQTRLPETDEQRKWLQDSYLFASDDFEASGIYETGLYVINEKTNKPDGQVLVALNAARTVTFSPFALAFRGQAQYTASEITWRNFVETSPKLEYTMGCIASVRDWHIQDGTPVSGQIIYANAATQFFPLLKEYLVREIGFLDSEIAILTGETPTAKREKIKEGFLDNSIKILIGSSAIREGMDLQTHCSVIYDLWMDWNPTDLHQLFGRGWRFGNRFSHVRIVVPQVENSSDIFTWQKLSEKIARLNSIWSRTGVTKMFEESDLSAEELKRGLITDPRELARYEIKEEIAFADGRMTVLTADSKEVEEAINFKARLNVVTDSLASALRDIEGYTPNQYWANSYPEKLTRLNEILAMPATFDEIKTVYQKIRAFSRLVSGTYLQPYIYIDGKAVDEHIKATKALKRVEDTILISYQLTIDQLGEVVVRIAEKVEELTETLIHLRSDEYFQEILERTTEQKNEENANRRTVADRVAEFARLNYLLDCKFGVDMCDLYGREANETPAPAALPKADGNAATDNADPIGEAIDALRTALEFTDEPELQTNLREAIEALEVAQEFA